MTDRKFKGEDFSSLLGKYILNDFRVPLEKYCFNGQQNRDDIKIEEPYFPAKPLKIDLQEKIDKLESLLNFYSELHHQTEDYGKIKIERGITREDFYKEYYFRNRPIVLKEMMNDWPALKKWSPDFFAQNFGSVPIEITTNRNQDADYEKNFRQSVATLPFSEFIAFVTQNADSNNSYIVARNYFFSNPAFNSLKEDLKPLIQILDSSCSGSNHIKLWFGPKGTLTPLHHDKHSILFTQVYGRKHFKLIPSFELNKVYNRDRYYSQVDPENIDAAKYPAFLKASLVDVIVEPGDMLFIPAGWWHWVKSLEISISVTFSNFYVKGFNTEWKCK